MRRRRPPNFRHSSFHTSADEPSNRGEIVFGIGPVRELIAATPSAIRTLYVEAMASRRFAPEISAVRASGGGVVRCASEALGQMAGPGGRHQGIIASIRGYGYVPLERIFEQKLDPLLVIDGVTDPRNLGAILRSSEGAGVKGVIVARDRTVALTPVAVKASAGAWAHLTIARCGNVVQTIEGLKAEGYWTAVLAPEGESSIYELDASRRLALILGSEGQGARELVKRTADFRVRIPMLGSGGSLNVAVASAVALFELARRRGQINVGSASDEAQGKGGD